MKGPKGHYEVRVKKSCWETNTPAPDANFSMLKSQYVAMACTEHIYQAVLSVPASLQEL